MGPNSRPTTVVPKRCAAKAARLAHQAAEVATARCQFEILDSLGEPFVLLLELLQLHENLSLRGNRGSSPGSSVGTRISITCWWVTAANSSITVHYRDFS